MFLLVGGGDVGDEELVLGFVVFVEVNFEYVVV